MGAKDKRTLGTPTSNLWARPEGHRRPSSEPVCLCHLFKKACALAKSHWRVFV